jgi:hypothetical protein
MMGLHIKSTRRRLEQTNTMFEAAYKPKIFVSPDRHQSELEQLSHHFTRNNLLDSYHALSLLLCYTEV